MSKRKNLERLATYLESLPVDYKEFDLCGRPRSLGWVVHAQSGE